jgi:Cu-Zn family superoxide dismutase
MIAFAQINGSPLNPKLHGLVFFRDVANGTQVCIEAEGLPNYRPAQDGNAPVGPHGFHIHESGICEVGDPQNPYQSAGPHWNPTDQPHGNHAGDFPVLFSNNGYCNMCFVTNKFNVQDIIGRSVIIHENPDDYRTQPSGNSGRKLGCGVIFAYGE